MSFHITEHTCKKCGGYFEVWEHNESGEKHVHTLFLKRRALPRFSYCTCREPQVGEDTDA